MISTFAPMAASAGAVVAIVLGFAAFLIVSSRRQARQSDPRLALKGIRTATQVDEYHLVHRIHNGQNSQVWEVFDECGDEHAAMKILTDAKGWDKELRRSLRHEWDVAQELDHPNLIRFKDFVDEASIAYIVMELFSAYNLKERILRKQRGFLVKHARSIMKQVAKALAYMHARGWVHRDIKPANILVAADGEVRLIDFGLAERVVRKWQRILPRRRNAQGTISYISPEQIRGERVDDRSDIYCLGATFYEMVTGRPPFIGQSPSDLLNKHLTEQPLSPQVYNLELSDEIAVLLQWMLEKKPEHRPPEVNVVLLRLRETPLFRTDEAQRRN